MLDDVFSSWIFYTIAALVMGWLVYGVWTGIQESKEVSRRVYGRLADLFEAKPLNYVVRSLSKPDSSKVGSVEFDNDSVITTVLCGPAGLFIDHRTRDMSYSIPWERIDSIEQLSEKRVSLRITDHADRPIEIVIPWSKDMTLDGWVRYNELKE